MSGVLTLLLGEETSGEATGSLGTLVWNNVYGPTGTRLGVTNTLTISGITGPLTLICTLNGRPLDRVGAVLNGAMPTYWPGGPISVVVHSGDTLAWAINNFNAGDAAGTATITRADTGEQVDTFTYFVQF